MPDGLAQVAAATTGGLSSAEAADRLRGTSPNELPRARRTPTWRLVVGQFRDPLILAAVGGALTVATGDLADTSVIVLVIVANAAVWVSRR